MAGIVEVQGLHPGGANLADGSVRILCQDNLQDMVRSIITQEPMHSIQVLRITSPGIIAILIGLLLPAREDLGTMGGAGLGSNPAALKIKGNAAESGFGALLPAINPAKNAAALPGFGKLPQLGQLGETVAQLPGALNFNQPISIKEEVAILPYIETALDTLRPYFAHDAQVELRSNTAVGELSHDKLAGLSKAFGVPILIGTAPGGTSWAGPITKATPGGVIQSI